MPVDKGTGSRYSPMGKPKKPVKPLNIVGRLDAPDPRKPRAKYTPVPSPDTRDRADNSRARNLGRGAAPSGGPGRAARAAAIKTFDAARRGKASVADVQRHLRAAGFDVAVDGKWGPQTERAAQLYAGKLNQSASKNALGKAQEYQRATMTPDPKRIQTVFGQDAFAVDKSARAVQHEMRQKATIALAMQDFARDQLREERRGTLDRYVGGGGLMGLVGKGLEKTGETIMEHTPEFQADFFSKFLGGQTALPGASTPIAPVPTGIGGAIATPAQMVGNVFDQTITDLYQMSVGAPGGMIIAAAHPAEAAKAIWKDYAYRYGPLFNGDMATFVERQAEHPLFFALDVAAVLQGAVKGLQIGGIVAKSPKVRQLQYREGRVQPWQSPSASTAKAQHWYDRFSERNPDLPLLGSRSRTARRLEFELERRHDETKAKSVPFEQAAKKLRGPERMAYDVMARYGNLAVDFVEAEINGRVARQNFRRISKREVILQKAQIAALKEARAALLNPRPQLLAAVDAGRRLSGISEGARIQMKLLTPETAADRVNLSAQIWGELPSIGEAQSRVRFYAQARQHLPDVQADAVLAATDAMARHWKRATNAADATEFWEAAVSANKAKLGFDPNTIMPDDLPDDVGMLYQEGMGGLMPHEGLPDTLDVEAVSKALLDSGLPLPPEISSIEGLKLVLENVWDLAKAGAPYRDWYQRAAASIKKVAEWEGYLPKRVAQVTAIYSQSATPTANMAFVVKALREHKDFGEVRSLGAGGKAQRDKVNAILGGEDWKGRKTNSFYANIIEDVDPDDYRALFGDNYKPVTVDRWVVRMLAPQLGKDVPGQFYDGMERALQLLAEQVGWLPKEIQAASWVTVKSRSLMQRYPGWSEQRAIRAAADAYEEGVDKHGAQGVLFQDDSQLLEAAAVQVKFQIAQGADMAVSVKETAAMFGVSPFKLAVEVHRADKTVERILSNREVWNEGIADYDRARRQGRLDYMAGENLEGLPQKVKVAGAEYNWHSYRLAQAAATDYMHGKGLPYKRPRTYAKVDPDRAARIAQWYESALHSPDDPEVAASYKAMAEETMEQYEAMMKTGLVVEFYPDADPYPNGPREAVLDVIENNHLYVFPTEAGYGMEGAPLKHPLLEDSGIRWGGRVVTHNDLFRAVHDYFGHIKEGVGFRADGEENAWRQHSAMYSPLARKAMTSETRGQNSWVNYGPHGERNQTAQQGETVYAEQKAVIPPDWVVREGAGDPDDGPAVLYQSDPDAFHRAAAEELANYAALARDIARTLPEEEWPAWVHNQIRLQAVGREPTIKLPDPDNPDTGTSGLTLPDDWAAQRRRHGAQGLRGAVEFESDPGKGAMYFGPKADISTFIHEPGHILRRALPEHEQQRLRAWMGMKHDEEWTPEWEEKFTRLLEGYFWRGQAPNARIREVFMTIREKMREVYPTSPAMGLPREMRDMGYKHLDEVFNPGFDLKAGDGAFFMPDVASWRGKGASSQRKRTLSGRNRKEIYPSRGILQHEGRIKRGPEQTLNDFYRSSRLQDHRMAIEEAKEYTVPLDYDAYPVTGGLPPGHVYFNPDGYKIMRANKETPELDDYIGMFPSELDSKMRAQYDELLRETFPPHVEGLPDEMLRKVRAIPENIANAFTGGSVKMRMAGDNPWVRGLRNVVDVTNGVMKAALIYGKLSYIPINFAGNLLFLTIAAGPFAAPALVRASRYLGGLDPETLAKIDFAVGEGPLAALAQEQSTAFNRGLRRLAYAQSSVADRLPRRAAYVYFAAKEGFKSGDDLAKLLDMSDEVWKDGITYKQAHHQIAETAEKAMVQFRGMSPFQRDVISRAIFIYGWMRGAAKYSARMPLDRPVRTNLIAHLGQENYEEVEKILGRVVSYMDGIQPVGKLEEKLGMDTRKVSQLRALNPVGTGAEALMALYNFVKGNPEAAGPQVSDYIAPAIKMPIELGTGFNLFFGEFYDNRWEAIYGQVPRFPLVAIGKQLIAPEVTPQLAGELPVNRQPNYVIEDEDAARIDAILNLILGSVRPRDLNVKAAQARGREERGETADLSAELQAQAKEVGVPVPPQAIEEAKLRAEYDRRSESNMDEKARLALVIDLYEEKTHSNMDGLRKAMENMTKEQAEAYAKSLQGNLWPYYNMIKQQIKARGGDDDGS